MHTPEQFQYLSAHVCNGLIVPYPTSRFGLAPESWACHMSSGQEKGILQGSCRILLKIYESMKLYIRSFYPRVSLCVD